MKETVFPELFGSPSFSPFTPGEASRKVPAFHNLFSPMLSLLIDLPERCNQLMVISSKTLYLLIIEPASLGISSPATSALFPIFFLQIPSEQDQLLLRWFLLLKR